MAGASFTRVASTPASKKSSPFNNGITKRSTGPKRNASILNFFKKTDGPPKSTQPRITQFGIKIVPAESGSSTKNNNNGGNSNGRTWRGQKSPGLLFFEDENSSRPRPTGIADRNDKEEEDGMEWFLRERSKTPDDDLWSNPNSPLKAEDAKVNNDNDEEERFNENDGSVKRRKIESPTPSSGASSVVRRRQGPFIDESDSENEDVAALREFDAKYSPPAALQEKKNSADVAADSASVTAKERNAAVDPPLVRAATRNAGNDPDEAVTDEFENAEDELQGEDFLEGSLVDEGKVAGLEEDEVVDLTGEAVDEYRERSPEVPTCPICQASLGGMTDSVSNYSSIGHHSC